MFFFSGDDLDIVFTLTSNGSIITPDPYNVVVSIYLDGILQAMGRPVLAGQIYHYSFSVADVDIEPRLYNVYSFVVETFDSGASLVANGSFLVHVSDYDSLDSTEVYLANDASEVYLAPALQTYQECLVAPPAKPRIVALETFKQTGTGCDCLTRS